MLAALAAADSGSWTLWVKRTDVDGADYSALGGLNSELTVDELKRRWVADQRLDTAASLVSLHKVKDGPGMPSFAEDQAAESEERRLGDPSASLGAAGVTNGCWLLAFAQGTVALTKPTFVQLLARGGIQRPSKAILRLIELHFATQASIVSDPEGAVHLYEFVCHLPGTRTKAAFAADLGITVGGPLSPAHSASLMGLLLSGSHSSGKSVIVKVLYADNVAKRTPGNEPMEAQLCNALAMAPWDAPEHAHFLVRATAVCMNVEPSEPHVFSRHGDCWAIVMPRYTATLGELAQLSLGAVAVGCMRIRTALDFMHSQGFVHADVKSANVLIASDGSWLLSDFGSCVRVREPLKSTTEVFHPSMCLKARDQHNNIIEVSAKRKFDRELLFCMLLVEAFKMDWKERLIPPGMGRVSKPAMCGAYEELLARSDAPEELRALARELNARAYKFGVTKGDDDDDDDEVEEM